MHRSGQHGPAQRPSTVTPFRVLLLQFVDSSDKPKPKAGLIQRDAIDLKDTDVRLSHEYCLAAGICLGFIVQLQNHALFRRDHGRVTIVIEKAWASLGVGVLRPWL
jgi:hypothetical protein